MKPFRWLYPIFLAACASSPTAPIADLPGDNDNARVRVIIPEAWELANIILAETDYGQRNATMIWKQGEYYHRVRAHFDGLRSSDAMKDMQLGDDDPVRRMYEFRENSVGWGFIDGQLVRGRRYGSLWQPDRFRQLSAEVQDFADASKYLDFYAANQSYYATLIGRYHDAARPDTMIDWLEREFGRHYDHYTIAISPLINGSHSTNRVSTSQGSEVVMFVSGPDVDGGASFSAGVRSSFVQRILFTEIDHNFVNPVTDQFANRVDAVFSDRTKWTTDASSFYTSPRAVFNEYMTWAVFFLYLDGRVSATDFNTILNSTTSLMQGGRRFSKFSAFNQELLRLWRSRAAGATVRDLYPAMLDWAARQ